MRPAMRDAMDYAKKAREGPDHPFVTRGHTAWEDDLREAIGSAEEKKWEEANGRRPHINTLLTWLEVCETGDEIIERGIRASSAYSTLTWLDFSARGADEVLGDIQPGERIMEFYHFSGTGRRLHLPRHLLTEGETREFVAWLKAQKTEYLARREHEKHARRKELRAARQAEIEERGGRWWNVY